MALGSDLIYFLCAGAEQPACTKSVCVHFLEYETCVASDCDKWGGHGNLSPGSGRGRRWGGVAGSLVHVRFGVDHSWRYGMRKARVGELVVEVGLLSFCS